MSAPAVGIVEIVIAKGRVSIDFPQGWEGVCCGPDTAKLVAAFRESGIELRLRTVACRLPEERAAEAVAAGACVAHERGGKENG